MTAIAGIATATRIVSPTPRPSSTAGPSPSPIVRLPPPAWTDDDGYWAPGHPTPDFVPELDWSDGPLSPDYTWQVRRGRHSNSDGTYFYRALAVVSTSQRHPVTQTIFAGWALDGIGQPEPAVLGWMPDSTAVFVYERMLGDGCVFAAGGKRLTKVNVATGTSTYVNTFPGEPKLAPAGNWIVAPSAPSSDGNSIARLDFIDTATLEKSQVDLDVAPVVPAPGWKLGPYNFVWSPSGSMVAASVTSNPCSGDARHGVIVADPGSMCPCQTAPHS